jgi:hypothetical protein
MRPDSRSDKVIECQRVVSREPTVHRPGDCCGLDLARSALGPRYIWSTVLFHNASQRRKVSGGQCVTVVESLVSGGVQCSVSMNATPCGTAQVPATRAHRHDRLVKRDN